MDNKYSEQLLTLIEYLNARTLEYEEGHPTISDKEWDDKYFELICMEKNLGFTYANSPTQNIIYNVVNSLEKVTHNHKMLSLDKTKDVEVVKSFVGNQEFIAMCKMDGLTCSLTYQNGRLVKAETRGNGIIGENILHNAVVIPTIPNTIPYAEELVVDGEIICTYSDFDSFSSDYKNPRNFAAGSVRLLDNKECEKRNLTFVAWDVVKGFENINKLSSRLNYLKTFNFTIVPYVFGEINNASELINIINSIAQLHSYPIDGIVFKFNDIQYGKSLGETSHHFKNAIAFKFYDEECSSSLIDIEWTMGRTGALTPVAIFETVDMDGSEVSRASLHNLSILEEILGPTPYVGQEVKVFKANMIIPQIPWADKEGKDGEEYKAITIPHICPICGGAVKTAVNDNVKVLTCTNENCEGKLINKIDHFCSKKGLDIKGLSKATLEKLITWGWINSISDIILLHKYREEWMKKPGFGQKSVDKILNAIEDAKTTTLEAFIASLGIPLIGQTVSKELVRHISSYEEFRNKAQNKFDFSEYDGFAFSKTTAIWDYDFTEADKIYPYLSFAMQEQEKKVDNTCNDLKVVVTGKLINYKNRDALKADIEAHGGKVVDSISKSVNYLINNDINSTSSKNLSAKKLGIPILTEQEFVNKYLTF